MYNTQPGHIDQIKQVNAGRVYKLIDQLGPISRIDLSRVSELAPASITKITRELIDAHLIKETPFQEVNSRGRPAIALLTDNVDWHFLSLRLGRGYLTIALHELGGSILFEEKQDIVEIEQDEVLAKLLLEIDLFFNKHASKLGRVTSIGITLPGLVNSAEGVVIQMPHYNVNNLALGPEIQTATGLPVYIANDTHAWALAEHFFGHSQENENSILISIHHGVGAGIILDSRVLQGRTGNIGELGHIQIDKLGKRCHCGNIGCLETVASSASLIEKVERHIDDGHQTLLNRDNLSVEKICLAANQGDELSIKVVTELGHHLGQAIAIMVNLFNPEKILIGGEINHAKSLLYPAILHCVESQAIPIYFKDLVLEQSKFYTEGTMAGAALIKQAMFNGTLLMKVIEG